MGDCLHRKLSNHLLSLSNHLLPEKCVSKHPLNVTGAVGGGGAVRGAVQGGAGVCDGVGGHGQPDLCNAAADAQPAHARQRQAARHRVRLQPGAAAEIVLVGVSTVHVPSVFGCSLTTELSLAGCVGASKASVSGCPFRRSTALGHRSVRSAAPRGVLSSVQPCSKARAKARTLRVSAAALRLIPSFWRILWCAGR